MCKYVCTRCLSEPAIQQFIQNNPIHKPCSYCDSANRPCSSIDVVTEYILECIATEFESAIYRTPYDGSDGGYQVETFNTYELLYNVAPIEAHDEVLEDIVSEIGDETWVESFDLSPEFYFRMGWARLVETTRKRRFTALLDTPETGSLDAEESASPQASIKYILKAFENFSCVRALPSDTILYRIRRCKKPGRLESAREMGSPPADKATQANRMSPVGVSMFYGALDAKTANEETAPTEKDKESKPYVHIAEFVASRTLFLVDFIKILNTSISLYENKKEQRAQLRLLHNLIQKFSKQRTENANEHLEYLPTQIITEYFRYCFEYNERPVDGIIYKSSVGARGAGGKCVVLFVENDDCVEKGCLPNKLERGSDQDLYLIMKKYRCETPSA